MLSGVFRETLPALSSSESEWSSDQLQCFIHPTTGGARPGETTTSGATSGDARAEGLTRREDHPSVIDT